MMRCMGRAHKMSLEPPTNRRERPDEGGEGGGQISAGCKCGVCHIGLLITAGVVTVCSETERQRAITAEIMSKFASQSCLSLWRGVPLRITHAEHDTEYPPR